MPDDLSPDFSFLAALAGMIEEESDLAASHLPPSPLCPTGKVIVDAGAVKDRPITLHIIPLDAVVDEGEADADDDSPLWLNASAVLPFEVQSEHLVEVMKAAFLLNRFSPFCSFGVSPDDRSCYVHASIPLASIYELDNGVALEVIEATCFTIATRTPMLHAIAQGEATLAALVSELTAQGFPIAPILPPPTVPAA